MIFSFYLLSLIVVGSASTRGKRQLFGSSNGLFDLPDLEELMPCNSIIRCNGKGICLGTVEKSSCICFLGFEGDSCDASTAPNFLDPFNLFGSMRSSENLFPSLNPFASFAENNIPTRGKRQALTGNGLFDLPSLEALMPCNSITRCNGKGLCIGNAEKSKCICFLGLQGDSCESSVGSNFMDPFNLFGSSGNDLLTSNSLLNLNDGTTTCTAADCSNNGVCVGTKTAPLCLCHLGKTGLKCENGISGLINTDPSAPITFCSPSDCNNKGLCIGTKSSFTCACQIGYTGSKCEKTPVSLCDARDCSSNGLCIGTKDSFTCACYLGYSGERCNEVTGTLCESSDCNSNGICIGTKTTKSCICSAGYYGSRCENRFALLPGTQGLFCETSDCAGNGICLGSKLLPTCMCAPGFTGLRCELEPLCTSLQCSNNGICLGSLKSFTCQCNLGWTGTFCSQSTLLGR